MSDTTREEMREAFERHIGVQEPRRILFRRGGSVFAEDVPEADYVDSGIQYRWKEWQAAWTASRQKALQEAAKLCLSIPGNGSWGVERNWHQQGRQDCERAIRSLGGITSNEGERG